MDNDFDHINEMSDNDINVIESQTPEVKSKCKKKKKVLIFGMEVL